MHKKIAVLAGDGIGPELMLACRPFLQKVVKDAGHTISLSEADVGWAAYDKFGTVLPASTMALCRQCDCILFGAVGLPGRNHWLPPEEQPERGALLPLRKKFGLGTNIRPVRIYPGLEHLSPLKNHLIKKGVNITFFRELISGDYFGRKTVIPGEWAADICRYERHEIEKIAVAAFKEAQRTNQKVTSIDKANILCATGTFWREVVTSVHDAVFSDVCLEHIYVDAFAAYLVQRPADFQIVLASNAHGDILSDLGGGIAGSLGLLPSASLNPRSNFGLYEPAAGSAPDIAGKGIANPIGMILSIALMLRYTFMDDETAVKIEEAVRHALFSGARTADISCGGSYLTTEAMVEAIAGNL